MAAETNHTSIRRKKAMTALDGYRNGLVVENQLTKLIAKAESRLTPATAQYEEMRSSGIARDAMADHVASLEDVAERLRMTDEIVKDNLDDLLVLVTKAAVINPDAGSVLSLRYMEAGKKQPSFKEIADKLHRGEDRVKQLHAVGLDVVADLIGA